MTSYNHRVKYQVYLKITLILMLIFAFSSNGSAGSEKWSSDAMGGSIVPQFDIDVERMGYRRIGEQWLNKYPELKGFETIITVFCNQGKQLGIYRFSKTRRAYAYAVRDGNALAEMYLDPDNDGIVDWRLNQGEFKIVNISAYGIQQVKREEQQEFQDGIFHCNVQKATIAICTFTTFGLYFELLLFLLFVDDIAGCIQGEDKFVSLKMISYTE